MAIHANGELMALGRGTACWQYIHTDCERYEKETGSGEII